MATTKLIRRRFHAATAAAAVVAAVIAVAPLMAGDPDPPATGTAYLNQSEGGGVHDQGHQAASPQAKAEACTTAPDGTPFCPEPPPSAAQITVAARSAGELGPEEPSQPDGMWGPLLHIPTTAIHAIVLPTGKVLFISQPKWPAETEYDGGNAHVWDPVTNTFTAVPPPVVEWPSGPDR